jgi:hypothetical protein
MIGVRFLWTFAVASENATTGAHLERLRRHNRGGTGSLIRYQTIDPIEAAIVTVKAVERTPIRNGVWLFADQQRALPAKQPPPITAGFIHASFFSLV